VNAAYWDEYLGVGNDFVNLLCWPAIERLLIVSPASEGLLDDIERFLSAWRYEERHAQNSL
jgi:hypothetical protein